MKPFALKSISPVGILTLCLATGSIAQTEFAEEPLPNPLGGMVDADILPGSGGSLHILATVKTTDTLFEFVWGDLCETHIIRDSSGAKTYFAMSDTGQYREEGFYGYQDRFFRAGALDRQENLFFCWGKQHGTWTDAGPFFWHWSPPRLQCITQQGSTCDTLFDLPQATNPAVAVGPDNRAHFALESVTPVRSDSNYQAYASQILYRSYSALGGLSPVLVVDIGFAPWIASNAPGLAHLIWLRGDSSTASAFQIMYRSIDAGTMSPAVPLRGTSSLPENLTRCVDSAGVIHVLWSETRPDGVRIYLLSYDGISVALDSSQGIPNAVPVRFAVSEGGIIHVAWAAYDGTRQKVYYTNSRTSTPFTNVRVFSSTDITFVDVLALFARSAGRAGAVFTYNSTMHYIKDLESGPDTTFVVAGADLPWGAMHAVTVDPNDDVWVVYGKNRFAFGGPQLSLGRFTDKPLAVGSHSRTPLSVALYQNYPNPFNPSTTIRYALPHRSLVTLIVYNTLGQQVAQLVNGDQDAGYHDVRFDGSGVASGMYFYRLQAGSFVQVKRLLLLR